MKYTREWVAYVDDLTVRTGRVVDGRYLTDDQAEDEIRQTCQNAPVEAVQPAGDALEALGVKGLDPPPVAGVPGVRNKHDEAASDHNHPTRRFLGSSRWVRALFFVFACRIRVASSPQPFCWLEDPRGSWESRGVAAAGRGAPLAADLRPAGRMGRGKGKGKGWWKKKDLREDPAEMGRAMTKAYRHGGHGHKGRLDAEGWISLEASAGVSESQSSI